MTLLALLEFRLEEPTVIEPLRIKHIAIHIIVKYPDLPVIPRIENVRLIVVERGLCPSASRMILARPSRPLRMSTGWEQR